MANAILRKTLFYSQYRTLYQTAVKYSAPVTFDQYKNQKMFSDVQSEVMHSLMDNPKLKEQSPDVKNWIVRVSGPVGIFLWDHLMVITTHECPQH